MKRREIIIGILLAAALVTGVVLTRGIGGGGVTPVVLDLTLADGSFEQGGITIEITARPRPLRVFESLRFVFRFARDGQAVAIENGRVEFNMTMDMGPNNYRLVHEEPDSWVARDVVLPRCGSGNRLWFADLSFTTEGREHHARLRMELAPPSGD